MRLIVLLTILLSFSVHATPVEEAFLAIYQPIVKAKGLDLKIETYEESEDYFGGASLLENAYVISIGQKVRSGNGGKLAFTLCHEVGHLLGGEPKKTTSTWASTEAQSDFYATSVCLKKLYLAFPQLLTSTILIPAEARRVCAQYFENDLEARVCEHSIYNTYSFFTDVWTFIDFSAIAKPSLKVQTPASVEKNRNYPSLQCRLEIGMAGALCRHPSCTKPACF